MSTMCFSFLEVCGYYSDPNNKLATALTFNMLTSAVNPSFGELVWLQTLEEKAKKKFICMHDLNSTFVTCDLTVLSSDLYITYRQQLRVQRLS